MQIGMNLTMNCLRGLLLMVVGCFHLGDRLDAEAGDYNDNDSPFDEVF